MAHAPLVVKVVADGSASILELSGRLEAGTVGLAQDKFAEAVALGPPIVLDLAKLAFLSSAGLRLILKTMKQTQATRQPFVIAGAKGPVKEILDSIGLRQFCPIVRNRGEALAKLV
jgi:anti-sigma B factor antagonist